MEGNVKAQKLGIISNCQICQKSAKTMFHVEDSDALVFVLQILYESMFSSSNEEQQQEEDKQEPENQTVISEDSVSIDDKYKS